MRKMNYSDIENVNGGSLIGFFLAMGVLFGGTIGIHRAKKYYNR